MFVLTSNVSYELGQKQAAGYSKDYLQTYAFSVWEYAVRHTNEMNIDNAFSYGEIRADWTLLTDKERHQNMIDNGNRAMEEKAKIN